MIPFGLDSTAQRPPTLVPCSNTVTLKMHSLEDDLRSVLAATSPAGPAPIIATETMVLCDVAVYVELSRLIYHIDIVLVLDETSRV